MDYSFFENLSVSEAKAYLDRFLELEATEVATMLGEVRAAGIKADFSVGSIAGVVRWIGSRIWVVPTSGISSGLRDSMEQHGGFLNFHEGSRPLVLRGSYYFGHSFVSSYPQLEWALGRAERAEFQQPVVTGFQTGADLPALVVVENLMLGANDSGFDQRVQTAVATWRKAV